MNALIDTLRQRRPDFAIETRPHATAPDLDVIAATWTGGDCCVVVHRDASDEERARQIGALLAYSLRLIEAEDAPPAED